MNLETPLAEVALHLPASAAAMLGNCGSVVQQAVLSRVRLFVTSVESKGTTLNAVDYEAVLDTFTKIMILEVGERLNVMRLAIQDPDSPLWRT